MKSTELIFCLQCRLSFTPLTRRARFCGYDCYTAYYLVQKAQEGYSQAKYQRDKRLKERAQQNEEDAKLLTRRDIEERFQGVFDLEWAP